ncbi:putative Neurexin IV [Daphnia magna]|uniref:Putative Neurexin IV n=1 Tax=Daphnia magna TaxID=35525 RepID=A0A164N6A8_9CRUS|nr:putative Neurexin IV [Daphnia magna]
MNNIDELKRHLELLNNVLNSNIESNVSEDELYERRIEVRRRMVSFYSQRADIFDLFDNDQIYKVFRFDKASIWYIKGILCFILRCLKILQIIYVFMNLNVFPLPCRAYLLQIRPQVIRSKMFGTNTCGLKIFCHWHVPINCGKCAEDKSTISVQYMYPMLCVTSSDHIFQPANLLEVMNH